MDHGFFNICLRLRSGLGAALLLSALIFSPAIQAAVSVDVRVNSVGYPTQYAKVASIVNAGPGNFDLRRVVDNVSVFNAALSPNVTDTDSGDNMRLADFSAFGVAGDYYLDVPGIGSSVNFTIDDNVYAESLRIQLLGLYGLRCGMAVSFNYGGDTFSHGACHLGDGDLQYYSGAGVKNGTRGWHDAGDFGKYTVNSSFATGMLLQAWEHHKAKLQSLSYAHLPAGEQSNGIPDYLDEIKWNLDWQIKMQFPDGRVSHKLTRTGFAPFIMPEADVDTRYFVPWGSPATAAFTAVMALAARVYAPYDAAFAAQCLAAANTSYTFLLANPANVGPDQSCCTTGGYGTNDPDDRLWAAAEMWETTGSGTALADFESRAAAWGDKTASDFDWSDVGNLGMITYARSTRPGKSAAIINDVINDLVNDANTIRNNAAGDPYGRGHNNYYWGVNGSIARQAMLLQTADYLNPDPTYQDAVVHQLSNLYGRNTYSRSKVTGEGINPPMNPHHRPSGADGIANPWPGLLVGGGHPGATDWQDVEASYATNENAINWTGAMVYALASMLPQPVSGSPTATPTISATSTITPTSSPTPCDNSLVLAVNAGGGFYTDGVGDDWQADQAFTPGGWGNMGGNPGGTTDPIAGTGDDPLFQDENWGDPLEYRFTLPNGDYQVRFLFVEGWATGNGVRVFDIDLEGVTVINNLDIHALVGHDVAWEETHSTTVTDGVLNIVGTASANNATINGIQIRSLGYNCFSPTYTDSPTYTASETYTSTGTPTPTETITFTQTSTPTFTITATPTPTLSVTATGTLSATSSQSSTPASTASRTATGTITGTGTLTATGTVTTTITPTETNTSTYTITYTVTDTVTPGATPTETVTSTLTPTPTVTYTITYTSTLTATPNETLTSTPTYTVSFTATVTRTITGGSTPTRTITPVETPTLTPTGTVTFTRTMTHTPTYTVTFTPSVTHTSTHTPFVTATVSLTAGPTGTETPVPVHFRINGAWPAPHPVVSDTAGIVVDIEGRANTVEIRLYSAGMTLVMHEQVQGVFTGFVTIPLPARFLSQAANGLYYARILIGRDLDDKIASKAIRLILLK